MPGPSWVGALASPDGLQARLDLDRPSKGPTIDLLLISSILEAQDWDLWKLLPFQEPVGHAWAGLSPTHFNRAWQLFLPVSYSSILEDLMVCTHNQAPSSGTASPPSQIPSGQL